MHDQADPSYRTRWPQPSTAPAAHQLRSLGCLPVIGERFASLHTRVNAKRQECLISAVVGRTTYALQRPHQRSNLLVASVRRAGAPCGDGFGFSRPLWTIRVAIRAFDAPPLHIVCGSRPSNHHVGCVAPRTRLQFIRHRTAISVLRGMHQRRSAGLDDGRGFRR